MDAIEIIILIIIIAIPIIVIKNIKEEQKLEDYKPEFPKKTQQQPYSKPIEERKQATTITQPSLYQKKKLLTKNEISYARAIQKATSYQYRLYPQVCLASIIQKTSDNTYANELFRIVDFGIFDTDYNIIALIEINDRSHKEWKRIERDKKVKDICESAGIPLITFWTDYGVNEEYIQKRIQEQLK